MSHILVPVFFTVIAGGFVGYLVDKKQYCTHLAILLSSEFASLFYEFVMSYTYDYYDVLAILLGFLPAYLILGLVLKMMKFYE